MLNIRTRYAAAIIAFLAVFFPSKPAAAISPDFINFGYLQNNEVLPYLHYESLTHIAPLFVDFLADGSLQNPGTFTGRSTYLKAGGAAERAGTKIILCVRNDNFDDDVILPGVMQNAANRTALVNNVKNLVINDPYCAGVNFDFEFNWTAATRDGITAFLQEMRAALPPPYEISIYVHAIYSSTYWNIPAVINNVDYVLYSTYDWATNTTVHAPADYNNCIPHIRTYLNSGVPPEKMVLTWASYGRQWANTTSYNQDSGNSDADASRGFYDGLYETTLRKTNGGPFSSNYLRGDEIGWYTYTAGGVNYTSVWETPESLEMKINAALSFPGASGQQQGVRLRGVGWWSLMWLGNYLEGFDARLPGTSTNVTRPHYYRHLYLLIQELLKAPGQQQFLLESFETPGTSTQAGSSHWRDPNEATDTAGDTDADSTLAFVAAPAGMNRPAGTTNAARLNFDFESGTATNKAFLRYEILNKVSEPTVTDVHAAVARIGKNSRVTVHYYPASGAAGRTLRLALLDGQREIEVSDARPIPATAGWYTFQWDINNPAQIAAWNTNEAAFLDGDGQVDTANPDARDIGFLGFIVEGGNAGAGSIYFDEVCYENRSPDGRSYVINEFRYSDNTSEFVEIAGPPGPFPADLRLLSYDSATGAVFESTSLGGYTMPATGLFVVGDTGVPAAGGSTGVKPANFSTADDIPNSSPGSLQLYGATSGYVYDSVVYAAHGGLADLARTETRGVSREGYGWLGNVGPGLAGSGQPYSKGRLPDGNDTDRNQTDFSAMSPTPGQPNGSAGITGTTHDFSTIPTSAFQTYQNMRAVNPALSGLPPSAPGDTSVYRCVDTSGGGVVAFFGDALIGQGTGLDVTGKVYIPATGHPAQAIGIGFCGTQGSTFFSASPQTSGYEDGYWLIYEHGTNGLADGRSDHPQQFEFVMVSNDNQDRIISSPLGARKSLAQVTAVAGTWADFHLRIDAAAAAGQQLLAQINGVDIYRGSIPAGGRTSGAVMVGFREGQGGTVLDQEGAWVDKLSINTFTSSVVDYQLY